MQSPTGAFRISIIAEDDLSAQCWAMDLLGIHAGFIRVLTHRGAKVPFRPGWVYTVTIFTKRVPQ